VEISRKQRLTDDRNQSRREIVEHRTEHRPRFSKGHRPDQPVKIKNGFLSVARGRENRLVGRGRTGGKKFPSRGQERTSGP